MGDAARALAGRDRRTPVPVEIDPEVTPPPQAPPAASLEDLSRVVGQLVDWVKPMAPLRHEGDRLDGKLDRILVEQAENGALLREFIMPALKSTMGSVDLLLSHYEANKIRHAHFYDREWPAASKKIDDLGERMGRLERAVERGTEQHESLEEHVDEVRRRSHANSERLKAIETNAAVEAKVQHALTTRQKVSVGAGASILGALAGLLSKWLG